MNKFWLRCALVLLGFGLSTAALATTYGFTGTVGGSDYPACSGSWSVSGTTYTCTKSVSLASGDSIVTASSITVVAYSGITLAGKNTIGSSTVAVNLQTDWGDIVASNNGNKTSTFYGNLSSSSGDINLTNAVVYGYLDTLDHVVLSGGSVSGNVSGRNGVTTTNGTVIGGSVTANAGEISLSGGSVAGSVHSDCCTITTYYTDIGGSVSTTVISSNTNTVSITGGTISGAISTSGGKGITIVSATVTSGSITATGVAITISNSTIGSSTSQVNVTGNNYVTITNSTIYGNVTAGNWASALTIDSASVIYGICTSDHNSVTTPTQYPRCAGASGSKVAKFNACHNYASGACSSSSARLYTQRSATAFSTDIVALKSDGTVDTSFTGKATISVIAKTSTGATLDSQNCFTADATQTIDNASSAFVAGRLTLSASVPTAYPDVRFKIVCDAKNCSSSSSGVSACSSDDFAIRPASFSSVSAAAANADASGASTSATPVVKAGAAFTLTATAGAGYNGTPKVSTALASAHSGAVRTGEVSASFAAAVAATGVATASGATYSEVGYFKFAVDGVYDDSFTAVDSLKGDCTSDYSNTAVNGKIGCSFGNTAATDYFGRFIPDHFALAASSFTAACVNSTDTTKSFSYMDQPFTLSATLEAQNASNDKTQNYQGSFANGVVSVQLENASSGVALADTRLAGRGTPVWSAGSYPFVATQFSRLSSGPDGSYEALDIGLTVSDESALAATARPYLKVRDMDAASTTCTVDNTGLLTASGVCTAKKIVSAAKLRYGRLRLANAYGSEKATLSLLMQAQYWSGNSWVQNSADSCTSLPFNAFALFTPAGAVSTCSGVSGTVSLASGQGNLVLSKPTGVCSVDVAANLGASGNDQSCLASHGGVAAGLPWLRSRNGSCASTYDRDPSARASFGVYSPETKKTVHVRELY